MALTDKKITDANIEQYGVIAEAGDRLSGTSMQNKAVFDRLVKKVVKDKFNKLIEALVASTGADEIGANDEELHVQGATVQAILNALDEKQAALESTEEPTGASKIGAVALDGETASTVQAVLAAIGAYLAALAASQVAADDSGMSKLSGGTVQAILESVDVALGSLTAADIEANNGVTEEPLQDLLNTILAALAAAATSAQLTAFEQALADDGVDSGTPGASLIGAVSLDGETGSNVAAVLYAIKTALAGKASSAALADDGIISGTPGAGLIGTTDLMGESSTVEAELLAHRNELDSLETYKMSKANPSGTGNLTMTGKVTAGAAATANNDLMRKGEVDAALAEKQDTLTFDNVPTANSGNPVKSGGVYDSLDRFDRMIICNLIHTLGMATALKIYIENNIATATLTDIVVRFFDVAATTVNETYSSEFYLYDTNTTSTGWKADDNVGLICTPSTNSTAGTDDYATLPLFCCFDVNYTIDATTLEPVIHAIKDVYGDFNKSASDSFVGVLQMTGWVRRTTTATIKKVEYRAQQTTGFVPLPESVRASNNTVRPFCIHAKYAAGLNANGKLSSISGVQPATLRNGSAGSKSISQSGQVALWRQWGSQYCGSSICDNAFVQLMLEIKYAVLGSAAVMHGCRNYSLSYKVAVSESNVKRALLTAAQANGFIVGSSVSLGTSNDRSNAACYNVCDIARIVSKEVVDVGGTSYTALNLETTTAFTTTANTTYIVTHPWGTGATDDVLGNDGSPTNNTNDKEPFKIQGIELCLGVFETVADTTLNETATSGGETGTYNVYVNRLAANITAGSSGINPVLVGTITKTGSANWKYIAEMNWVANDQEAYLLGQEFGASASTGYRAAQYLDGESTTGLREWLAYGNLYDGGLGGIAFARLNSALGGTSWYYGCRALGTGGNRGAYSA